VESIVTTLGRFPQGIVAIVPTQLPANFLDRAGAGVDAARDGAVARTVFVSVVCFGFGLAGCSGTGVELSSTIGAGSRCVPISNTAHTKQNRLSIFMSI
jgi:hypothetical protein